MKLFNYDSRISEYLSKFVDICLVNLVFAITCIPVLTYGAAKTALFMCAVRWIDGEEADIKDYFRFFRNNLQSGLLPGFIVILFTAVLIPDWLFSLSEYGNPIFIAISAVVTAVFVLYKEQLFLCNARLVCSGIGLLRNGMIMTLANPLKALFCALPIVLPLILLLFFSTTFIKIAPLLPFFYYSLASIFTVWIMDKPYRKIISENTETDETEQK